MNEIFKDFCRVFTLLMVIWISFDVNVRIPLKISETTHKFYDSNGKEIPYNIVNLLVKDQFVHLDSTEYKELDSYFFYRKKRY